MERRQAGREGGGSETISNHFNIPALWRDSAFVSPLSVCRAGEQQLRGVPATHIPLRKQTFRCSALHSSRGYLPTGSEHICLNAVRIRSDSWECQQSLSTECTQTRAYKSDNYSFTDVVLQRANLSVPRARPVTWARGLLLNSLALASLSSHGDGSVCAVMQLSETHRGPASLTHLPSHQDATEHTLPRKTSCVLYLRVA